MDVPTDWEESIALTGEVGDYVAYARKERGGRDWYVGALTNEDARDLALPLTFLDEGVSYVAEIYRDGPDADWDSNPYDMVIEKVEVGRESVLALPLARGGGAAIRFVAQ